MRALFILSLLLLASPLHACWRLEGELTVGHERLKINQKVEHHKSYVFRIHQYDVHMTFSDESLKNQLIEFEIKKMSKMQLNTIARGKIRFSENQFGTFKIEETEVKAPIIFELKLHQI